MLSRVLVAVFLVSSAFASDDFNLLAPFGVAAGDTVESRCDDCYFGPFDFEFSFYGETKSSLYISNNGIISFNGGVSTFTSSGLCDLTFPAIAPYWADIYTSDLASGLVYHRVTTDASFLATYSAMTPDRNFHGVRAMVITYDHTCRYATCDGKTVTAQAILITDGPNSYVFFRYGDLQWATGAASGGVNGFGGRQSTIGFASGTGQCVQTLESATDGVIDTRNFVTRVSGATIVISRCGDGVVDAGEECDGGACCSAQCTLDTSAACVCGSQTYASVFTMKYICAADGGFYQCRTGPWAAQSAKMSCGAGTVCACATGSECSCDNTRSPCLFPGQLQIC